MESRSSEVNNLDTCFHCDSRNELKTYNCWVTLSGPFGKHNSMLATGFLCCLTCKEKMEYGDAYTHVYSFELTEVEND